MLFTLLLFLLAEVELAEVHVHLAGLDMVRAENPHAAEKRSLVQVACVFQLAFVDQ
jgi:hypothetical protein